MSVATDGMPLPPLRLNHRWVWEYVDAAANFAAAEVDIYLDKVEASTPTRVTLTEESGGVTRTATAIACDQSPVWVLANLSAGTWEFHLLVDKVEECWGRLEVLTPPAGGYTP